MAKKTLLNLIGTWKYKLANIFFFQFWVGRGSNFDGKILINKVLEFEQNNSLRHGKKVINTGNRSILLPFMIFKLQNNIKYT